MPEATDYLSKLKDMLLLDTDNSKRDKALKVILDNTEAQLRLKLSLESEQSYPNELNYILLQVSAKRYNRLKNEGMTSYSQEGESITFEANDFDEFLDDIASWRKANDKDIKTLGTVHFINGYGSES
ncbi:phage head-tail connector protein [Agrilactobacillus fermenti]|uniref:phage head-tail connector protein n=1 Tax=Agrilactobacillus fermenti TaxID=2586909 RepID=UPI001E34ADAA|nr:phage head-tail connector protein [Agrilactobacillus fermenti]MCD2256415.1 phage head-tail connector protein [Agrilactobacillus fermenti]